VERRRVLAVVKVGHAEAGNSDSTTGCHAALPWERVRGEKDKTVTDQPVAGECRVGAQTLLRFGASRGSEHPESACLRAAFGQSGRRTVGVCCLRMPASLYHHGTAAFGQKETVEQSAESSHCSCLGVCYRPSRRIAAIHDFLLLYRTS